MVVSGSLGRKLDAGTFQVVLGRAILQADGGELRMRSIPRLCQSPAVRLNLAVMAYRAETASPVCRVFLVCSARMLQLKVRVLKCSERLFFEWSPKSDERTPEGWPQSEERTCTSPSLVFDSCCYSRCPPKKPQITLRGLNAMTPQQKAGHAQKGNTSQRLRKVVHSKRSPCQGECRLPRRQNTYQALVGLNSQ